MSSEQWIKAKAVLVVDPKQNRIVASLGYDFISYYAFLLENQLKSSFSYPKFGAHISIGLPLHGKIDFERAKKYHGRRVEFEYNPDFVIGGKRSGVRNFWMKVRSPEIEAIKKDLNIKDDERYLGLHVTIMSAKGGERKFQKQMIELR